MDHKDLLIKQNQLQKEGNEVLEKLQLIEFLNKLGKPIIVGSLATGLMTWRDIDIEVVVELDSNTNIFETINYLFEIENVKNINLQNNVRYRIRDYNPDGMYLGFQYQNNEIWKVDIWFLSTEQHSGKDDIEWFLKNINEEDKKSILLIKNQMAVHPQYRKTIYSQDIYNAVLKEKVKTYEEFAAYLTRIGKEI